MSCDVNCEQLMPQQMCRVELSSLCFQFAFTAASITSNSSEEWCKFAQIKLSQQNSTQTLPLRQRVDQQADSIISCCYSAMQHFQADFTTNIPLSNAMAAAGEVDADAGSSSCAHQHSLGCFMRPPDCKERVPWQAVPISLA